MARLFICPVCGEKVSNWKVFYFHGVMKHSCGSKLVRTTYSQLSATERLFAPIMFAVPLAEGLAIDSLWTKILVPLLFLIYVLIHNYIFAKELVVYKPADNYAMEGITIIGSGFAFYFIVKILKQVFV